MSVGRPKLSHMVCYGKDSPVPIKDPLKSSTNAGEAASFGAAAAAAAAATTTAELEHQSWYDPTIALSPDLADRGVQLWSRGIGLQAAHIAMDFLKRCMAEDAVLFFSSLLNCHSRGHCVAI